MQNLTNVLTAGLGLFPIMGGMAVLLIAIQYYKFNKIGKQFADCAVRKGIVQEMGIREPTRLRPYRHCTVKCSFSNESDLIEIPYNNGDLAQAKVGAEIPVYFYANGVVTVVAYDKETTKKKIKQQILVILVLCVVMSFLIPTVGFIMMNRISK